MQETESKIELQFEKEKWWCMLGKKTIGLLLE
jgi:hypothetical protein